MPLVDDQPVDQAVGDAVDPGAAVKRIEHRGTGERRGAGIGVGLRIGLDRFLAGRDGLERDGGSGDQQEHLEPGLERARTAPRCLRDVAMLPRSA